MPILPESLEAAKKQCIARSARRTPQSLALACVLLGATFANAQAPNPIISQAEPNSQPRSDFQPRSEFQPTELASTAGPGFSSSASDPETTPAADAPATEATDLPDAPGFQQSQTPSPTGTTDNGHPRTPEAVQPASHYQKYILPGQQAPRLRASDKFILGFRDSVSVNAPIGWVLAASYEQIFNNSPNYGQTGKGYAQRLGAAAARATSERVFGDSILAPLLHEDPRYFKMGGGHNPIKRIAYAGSRAFITRTDGGHHTINFAGLGGNLAGAALTQAYYPSLNRGFDETMKTFGGAVFGTAAGFVVSEYLADFLELVHVHKVPLL